MSKFNISYYGGIDSSDRNLTGSATILDIDNENGKKLKVLIDFGMYQGSRDDNKSNLEIDDNIIKTDYVILTHAHMDHSGRLPLLVKKGFKGKIIMTDLTKQKIEVMLRDYVRLVSEAIEDVKEKNKKQSELINYNLKIKNLNDKLLGNGLSKIEQRKIKTTLQKLTQSQDYGKGVLKSIEFLEKFGVKTQEDILNILEKPPVLLYDYDDIDKMLLQVETLEIGEKKQIERTFYIFDLDNPYIDKLPEMVSLGFDKEVFIHPLLKTAILNRWEELLEEFKQKLSKNNEIKKANSLKLKEHEELIVILSRALNYVKDVDSSIISKDENHYKEQKALLKEYDIKKKEDIDNLKPNVEPIYTPPFTKKDLANTKKFLISDLNMLKSRVSTDFKLRFIDAGHIEGSIQALITVVDKKVKHIVDGGIPKKDLDIKEYNLLFSGDLGRVKDPNLSGTPEIPAKQIDYYQVESTYAGRNHIEKKESIESFVRVINNAPGKVIIPAFSMQRTQEILMIILEEMKQGLHAISGVKKLTKEKQELEIKLKNDIFTKEEAEELQIKINDLDKLIDYGKQYIFDYEIYVDSPLSQAITEIYIKNLGDKYNLLKPGVQKSIFGKVIIKYLEQGEYKDLYTPKNRNKKQIIISASGMCQGGSVINHLEENLENQLSTLVFVGYTPENTIGGQIKQKNNIILNGNPFRVNCRVEDITGFSGHICEDEILDYLKNMNLAKNTKISLTHGGYERRNLSKKVEDILKKTTKKIEVLVPNLKDSIKLKI